MAGIPAARTGTGRTRTGPRPVETAPDWQRPRAPQAAAGAHAAPPRLGSPPSPSSHARSPAPPASPARSPSSFARASRSPSRSAAPPTRLPAGAVIAVVGGRPASRADAASRGDAAAGGGPATAGGPAVGGGAPSRAGSSPQPAAQPLRSALVRGLATGAWRVAGAGLAGLGAAACLAGGALTILAPVVAVAALLGAIAWAGPPVTVIVSAMFVLPPLGQGLYRLGIGSLRLAASMLHPAARE